MINGNNRGRIEGRNGVKEREGKMNKEKLRVRK